MALSLIYGYDGVLPNTGADAEQVLSTITAIARAGVKVTLVTIAPKEDVTLTCEWLCEHYEVSGQFEVRTIDVGHGNRGIQKWKFARAMAKAIAVDDEAVIHTRHIPVAHYMLKAGHRVVYDTYRPWSVQYPLLRPLLRRIVNHRNFIGVMCHSEHAADSFRTLTDRDDDIVIMHNGYDPNRLRPVRSKSDARGELGLPADAFIVSYTGRVGPDKGIDTILDVARVCPDISFLIVGSESEGPLELAARDMPNVDFEPWQPYHRTALFLYASDLLLIPPSAAPLKRHGSTVLPLKLFPYLASGRPIVAPRAVDTRELLRHEENAFLVEPGNIESIAADLQRLKNDDALRESIGAAAREQSEELTWGARGRRIIDFIRARTPGPSV